MKARQLLQFFGRSAALGIVVAAIVLLALPWLDQNGQPQTNQAPISFADAVNRAAPAVVNIYSVGEVRGSFFNPRPTTVWRLGSGVIMNSRGYILTAYHVVTDVDQIQIALQDGRRYGAQLVGSDRYTDLAVLKIDADNLPVIPQSDSLNPRVGDVVLAIGNPYNLGQTITQGIISATGGRIGVSNSYSDLIQMDAVINEGASGGALVNSNGVLVGINNASYNSLTGEGGEGIYFAVPGSNAKRVMQKIITDGEVVRGYLGINVGDSLNSQRPVPGITVTEVAAGSPAALAGLEVDDFIVEFDGKSVSTPAEGLDLVANTKPGTVLTIRFYRGDELRTVDAVIGKLPE